MKMRLYDNRGRERFLAVGQVAPAGWFRDGQPPVALAREMRVEERVAEGNPYDQFPVQRRWLELVPNISVAEAAAERAKKLAADGVALSAALGGLAWRIDASGKAPSDVLADLSPWGKNPSPLGRAVARVIASAEVGAVVVFGSEIHVELPDGRHSVHNRSGWTTAAGRAARDAAAAVAASINPKLRVDLAPGDVVEIRLGSEGLAVKAGEDVAQVCRQVVEMSRAFSARCAAIPDDYSDIGGGGYSKVD